MLQRHSEDLELTATETPADASSEYSDDNCGVIFDDDFESPPLSSSPLVHAVAGTKEKATVTIDPTPSTNKHVPRIGSETITPKSILKKTSSVAHEVTPAPVPAHETKKQVETETSSSDEMVELAETRLPFITPTPGRGRQTHDKPAGFLAKLDQVADSHTCNAEYSEEDDEDVFEDPLNEEIDMYEPDIGESPNDTSVISLRNAVVKVDAVGAASPGSKWPSIHDVFYGLHDEDEHIECTSQDMHVFTARGAETMTMNPFLGTFHEFFFGPEGEFDVDSVPSLTPEISSRHRLFRGTSLSAARVVVVAFVLWQATLVPNNKGIPVPISKRPGVRSSALPFAVDSKALFEEREQARRPQGWLSKLW